MTLLINDDIDHAPVDGWLQKYVYLFVAYEGKKRKFMFNFANQYSMGEFNAKPMDIGEYISPRVWIPAFEKRVMPMTEETVKSSKVTGSPYKTEGVWGVAYGAPMLQYKEGVPVGVKMYWVEFCPLEKAECQKYIKEQWNMIKEGLLVERPRLEDYLHLREEEHGG